MGKFKQINIDIEELIPKLIIIVAFLSSILLLLTCVENEMLKEKITLLEQDKNELVTEIRQLKEQNK